MGRWLVTLLILLFIGSAFAQTSKEMKLAEFFARQKISQKDRQRISSWLDRRYPNVDWNKMLCHFGIQKKNGKPSATDADSDTIPYELVSIKPKLKAQPIRTDNHTVVTNSAEDIINVHLDNMNKNSQQNLEVSVIHLNPRLLKSGGMDYENLKQKLLSMTHSRFGVKVVEEDPIMDNEVAAPMIGYMAETRKIVQPPAIQHYQVLTVECFRQREPVKEIEELSNQLPVPPKLLASVIKVAPETPKAQNAAQVTTAPEPSEDRVRFKLRLHLFGTPESREEKRFERQTRRGIRHQNECPW